MKRFGWTGWEAETDLGNPDDRVNVEFLTITDDGEELAIIVHRNAARLNNKALKRKKELRAQRIVNALNAAVTR